MKSERIKQQYFSFDRLPPTPYLGVTATLGRDKVDTIKTNDGFDPDCHIVRTSVDRPKISTHVIVAECNLSTFDDLRRFFLLGKDIRCRQDIPKTVFYLLAFVKIVRDF